MTIDEILAHSEQTLNSPCGFFITRDGKDYHLTVAEAADAMNALLCLAGKSMAAKYLKQFHNTTFPDAVLNDMAARYAKKTMNAIPLLLDRIVRDDLNY